MKVRSRSTLDEHTVENAVQEGSPTQGEAAHREASRHETSTPKGFTNAATLVEFFDAHLTRHDVRRPVVLVLDNSSTHLGTGYSILGEISASFELGILLLPLPPNATHLYQPLDGAVFKPFKAMVKTALHAKLLVSSACTISKTDAIGIACNAYRVALTKRPSNAVNGFRTTGLYLPSLVNMQGRLRLFASGGARGNLASGSKGKSRRVTVDYEGRLITKEMLQQGDM
ncbi:LOW QUALITY PROTEIN: hypothetical protein PHMEG_00038251, partial [Phytophthora megakarya]